MRRDDNKLSLLASTDLFHPITGTCHVTVFWPRGCFLLGGLSCVVFAFWFFVFRFFFFGT